MFDAPLALALTTGVVAAFNPCGFAMLPAYLSYFVGASSSSENPARSTAERLVRAAVVGATVTAGFVVVFGAIGFVVSEISSSVLGAAHWFTVAIGLALVAMGVAMVRGYEPTIGLPRLGGVRKGTSLRSMFVYGLSYATVSLGCTLPPFLAIVVSSFSRTSVVDGMALFVAYALGMGLVVIALTMAVAAAQHTFVRSTRRLLPFVNRALGVLLVVAGGYVAFYGWFERATLQGDGGDVAGGSIVDVVTGWSSSVNTWVTGNLGTSALVGGLVILALVVAASLSVQNRSPRSPAEEMST